MDWRYSRDKDGDEYDPVVAKQAEDVLDLLSASTREIYDVTDKGIKSMVQMHIQLKLTSVAVYLRKEGHGRRKGSSTCFSTAWKKLRGKTYSHGEVLGTGCVLGAYIHGASVDEIIRELDSFGLQFRPKDYGLTFSDFESAVSNMKEVTAAMNSYYPVLRDRFPKDSDISEVWRILN